MAEFQSRISELDVKKYFNPNGLQDVATCVTAIPVSVLNNHLEKCKHWEDYTREVSIKYKEMGQFRDGFWISTTARFFYIEALMEVFHLKKCFHIENDIMMYETFQNIYNFMENVEQMNTSNIWMVKDCLSRVVPSIVYIPNSEKLHSLNQHISKTVLHSSTFVNDMEILGSFTEKELFPCTASKFTESKLNESQLHTKMIFDGAAIGQYLGGVDTRNLQVEESKRELVKYLNPSVGFINETSVFKPNTCVFSRMMVTSDTHTIPMKMQICKPKGSNIIMNVANLHIHSKQLYRFSSVFDLDYNDIITGDRIVEMCDFVICTKEIYKYHVGLDKFARDVICVKDWTNINIMKLNEFFREFCVKNKTKEVKLFIYTHILEQFQSCILKRLDPLFKYVLYIHNSDHPFDDKYKDIVEDSRIKHIFAQNIDYSKDIGKLTLLPIGIANSMWKHGDLMSLYKVMTECYKNKKSKNIYVNINPSTYEYRKDVLDAVQKSGCWPLSGSKQYIDYLKELAEHRFCLCMRGNGLDTHRFWECLYLGVIPVIIANKITQLDKFICYVRKLNIPYVIIQEDDLDSMCKKYTLDYFGEEKYYRVIRESGISLHCNPSLKVSSYSV